MHTSQLRTIRRRSPSRPRGGRWGRTGFTLTELLVVIAIIGVLAGLITAAAVNAFRAARRNRIVLEVKNITASLESFNTDLNSYPPNGMNDGSPAMIKFVSSDFERAAKAAFPRIDPLELSVFRALAGDGTGVTAVTSGPLQGGLSAAEALYFWLGGFSSDPKFPLTGTGGPGFVVAEGEVMENRQQRYEFNLASLGPRTEAGFFDDSPGVGRFILYTPNMNGDVRPRRINLWQVYPSGSERPLVYFDASRHRPAQYDMPAYPPSEFPDEPVIFPLLQLRSGAVAVGGTPRNLTFVNQKKFQLLHAGLDDAWGNFSPMGIPPRLPATAAVNDLLLFPTGPFLDEVADTLTNFAEGPLEDSQPE
jgi:prepilin-type N-terminal cleavage/methylation domain-containing protein